MNIFTKIPAEHRYKRILESLVNKYRVIAVFQIIALVLIITLMFYIAHLYNKSFVYLIYVLFLPLSLVNSLISFKLKMLQKYSGDVFRIWCEYLIKENNLQIFLDPLNMHNNISSKLYSFINKVFEFNANRLKERSNFKFVDICSFTYITTRVMPILIQQNPNILNSEPFKKLKINLKTFFLFVIMVVCCIVAYHYYFDMTISEVVIYSIFLPLALISLFVGLYMLLYVIMIYFFFISSSFQSIRAIIMVVFLMEHRNLYLNISPFEVSDIRTFYISFGSYAVVKTIESYLYPNQENDVYIEDEGEKLT